MDDIERSGRARVRRTVTAIVLLASLVLGACSGNSGDDSGGDAAGDLGGTAEDSATFVAGEESGVEASADAESGEAAAPDDAAAEEESASAAEGEPIGTGGADVGALQPADIGRDIVFTARISVAVDDVVTAGRDALGVVEALGGLLFGQETSVADVPRTVLVFKVAPEDFQTAVARLGDVGVLTDQVITADDVTERVVDLESRIVTAAASVERLRGFLEEATELETVASLERELLTRETDLELLRGQLRTLQGQVDLATITVELRQKRPEPTLAVDLTWVAGGDEPVTSCRGSDDLEVDEGDDVTVCIEIVNDGDTPLTELTVRHRDLDLELDDLDIVSGDPSTLTPGQAVVLAATFEAGPSISGSVQVTARAVDAEGTDLDLGTVETSDDGRLDVAQEVTLPGVTDALSTGWGALRFAASIVVLGLAVALPFLWLPLVVWAGVRWWRRRGTPAAPAAPTSPPGEGPPASAEPPMPPAPS